MASVCHAIECGEHLHEFNTSARNHDFCARCDEDVWAFLPQGAAPLDWHLVCWPGESPTPGETFDSDQCEGCGGGTYQVISDRYGVLWARCCPGVIDDYAYDGCGAEYPIRVKPARLVIF